MKKFYVIASALAIGLLCASCSVTSYTKDGGRVRRYFGYLKVEEPPKVGNQEFDVREIKTFGLRFDKGFGLGYYDERVELVPLDCRLVIRVKNKEQLKWVEENILPILKEGELCATVESE